MRQTLIGSYMTELERLRQVSGSHPGSVRREAFKEMLMACGRQQDLISVPEYIVQGLKHLPR